MLLEEFLNPMSFAQRELANLVRIPCQGISELANELKGMTLSTALRLARLFEVSADLWMKL